MARIVDCAFTVRNAGQTLNVGIQDLFTKTITSDMGIIVFQQTNNASRVDLTFRDSSGTSLGATNITSYTSYGSSSAVMVAYLTTNANLVDSIFYNATSTSYYGIYAIYIIEGHNTSSMIDSYSIRSDGARVLNSTYYGITTTTNNCLILYNAAIASYVAYENAWDGTGFVLNSSIFSAIGSFSAYGYKETAGAISNMTLASAFYKYSCGSVFAIKDATPSTPTLGIIPVQKATAKLPYNNTSIATSAGFSTLGLSEPLNRDSIAPNFTFDPATVLASSLFTYANHPFFKNDIVRYDANGNTPITGLTDGGYYQICESPYSSSTFALATPNTGTQLTISGGTGTHKLIETGAYVRATTTTNSSGTFTPSTYTNGRVHCGIAFALSSTTNFTDKTAVFEMTIQQRVNLQALAFDGVMVVLFSANGWRSFRIAGSDRGQDMTTLTFRCFVDANSSDYIKTKGSFDITSVTHFGIFYNSYGSASHVATVYPPSIGTKYIVSGGNSTNPFTLTQFTKICNEAFEYGSGVNISGFGLQVGDGSHTTTFEPPLVAGQIAQQSDLLLDGKYNLKNSLHGIEFYGTSSCSFTWNVPYYGGYFRVHSSSSSSATYNFDNSIITCNYETVFRSFNTINSVQFINSCRVTDNGATMTNCVFKNCQNSNGYLLWNSSTHVTDSIFQNNNYAIEIDTAGDYTLTGITFTNNTHDIHVTATSGIVNITVAGGGSNPSYVSEGATVNIISGASLSFTGLYANSEVRVYLGTDPSTATEIGGIENSTTSFSMSHSNGGSDGYVQIHHVDYESITLPITFSSSDVSIPIQQRKDRQYSNPT